ncbi:hypothetical protein [Paracoccus sp. PAR01]|uniref:hypothetical protein n=1 Tax=Paracoccus sp. PAR01 TaxID=2769282 RepID=UPI00177F3121|nr:hypothetical protein [Paracoccus sp. PAR01]MBD9528971.1 hypothetical protein [Paracoccus sp. PAR01]
MAIFEIQGPDGKTYEIDAPDQNAALTAFRGFIGQVGGTEQPTGQGFGNNVAQQAGDGLFLGFGDEISAGLNAMTGYDANTGTYGNWGTSYDDQLKAVRGQEEQFQADHPYISAAAEIGGAVLPAMTGVGIAAQAPTLAARAGTGAALGAGAGAVQGFGEGEGGLGNRLNTAASGAVIGGALGGAVPVAGSALRHLWQAGSGAVRNGRIGAQIGEKLGVNRATGKVLSRLLAGQDQKAIMEGLAAGGDDAMLADASAGLTGALDGAMRSPISGAQLAQDRVNERAGQSYTGVMDALVGGQQGPRMPPAETQRRMAQGARGQVNQAYQQAYGTPIDYASPEGRAIEELIGRVPPKRAQAAINSATDRMIYDGMPSPQILANVADDGRVSLSQLPNVMQLDYMKRAFDEVAEDSKDAITGRMTSDGAFSGRIARDIREATKDAVPAYGEALDVAANDIRQRSAVRTGQRILSADFSVEDALSEISDATGAERRAIRDGLIGQIDNVLGNVRAVASDQNIDARQAAKAYSDMSSPSARRKMEALFGEEWPAIRESLDSAGRALMLRARTSPNSSTGVRQMFNDIVAETVEPSALQQGKPVTALRGALGELTGASREAVGRARDEVKGEIADLLTRQGGEEPKRILQAIFAAQLSNPLHPGVGLGPERALMRAAGSAVPYATEQTQRLLGLLR